MSKENKKVKFKPNLKDINTSISNLSNVNKKINVVKKKPSKIKQMDITKWVI